MTIHLGPHTLDPPAFLAPMTGITDVPFRRLVRDLGGALMFAPEMREGNVYDFTELADEIIESRLES